MLRVKVSSLLELLGLIALVVALMAPSSVVAGSNITISPNCPDRCGNISIPYPFGVGAGCFMEGFELTCAVNNGSLYIDHNNVEMIDISLTTGEARIYKYMSYACYNVTGGRTEQKSYHINFSGSPYMFSSARNKFTAIGCWTLAYVTGRSWEEYMSGCLSLCGSEAEVEASGACNGKGCCQTDIPKGLDFYNVSFDDGFNHSGVDSFSPCSYSFLAEEGWFRFDPSDVIQRNFYQKNHGRVRLVLDWAIRNGTCQTAEACRSRHSECFNAANGPGYICNCTDGFQGNPYLEDGCQDIDECTVGGESYTCYGVCNNTMGSYECSCPPGTHGNPRVANCTADIQKHKESAATKFALGGIICFVMIATTFLVYERTKLMRAKRRCFEENGGLLLREQINAHQGVNFKIFNKEEMEKATRNFDSSLIQGRGGFGTVFKGELDDQKIVAIKKSNNANQKQRKEFAKEMYIVSLLNHKNVIKILGCCLEVEVPMLIYQFVSGGNLHDFIHNKHAKLPLDLRFKIAVESASALAYIHTDAEPHVLHGDMKPSNILIGDGYKPILSDFGGSLLSIKDQDLMEIQGTKGYLDPECLRTGQITEKSDVYSFAVVVLELFTRRKVISEGYVSLVSTFMPMSGGNKFTDIIDMDLMNEITPKQLQELGQLLEHCLNPEGALRPTMKEVEERLQRLAKMGNKSVTEAGERNPALMMAASIEPPTSTDIISTQYPEGYSGTAFSLHYDAR